MNYEKPAVGILTQHDYGDMKTYKVVCDCSCDEHSHNVLVEADISGVTVTTYTTQKTNFWSMNRWQHIWKLLFKGYVEYEASIIMSRQQAFNYAQTLNSAITDVEEFRKTK